MIKVLGPLTVFDSRRRALKLAPKPRKILALLATHPNQLVSVRVLERDLWDDPPRSATTVIQTYIGQLRRLLATAFGIDLADVAEHILVTEENCYGLTVGTEMLDVLEYVQVGNAGKAAVRNGDHSEGEKLLASALSMWRGPALVNVDPGPVLRGQVSRLEECRLCCLEYRIVAELHLGEHRGLVSQLVELTTAHPLHESLHGHLMLALYRSGRRSEALAVYHRLRTRLSDDLGLDPSPEIVRMHQAVLTGDAALDHPTGAGLPLTPTAA